MTARSKTSASFRHAWWERSAEASPFAHHTRARPLCPRSMPSRRTTRRHAASATARFLSPSRRPRTSSVVRGRCFLLRTALGLSRLGSVTRSLPPSLEMLTIFGRQAPFLACPCCGSRCIERLIFRKTRAVAEKSAQLSTKSPPVFAQTRQLFIRTSTAQKKNR